MIRVLVLLMILAFASCKHAKQDDTGNTSQDTYQLVWADEFDDNSINSDNWSFEIWNAGRVNNEWQQYVENTDNYKVEDGLLHITVTKTGENARGGYTSTRLSSKGKREFTYGRFEFRAKMPSGVGTWPALWMLGANISEVGWPVCGEIDVMEYVGFQADTTHNNVHTKFQSGVTDYSKDIPLVTAEEDFHVYGLTWTPNSLDFYLDTPENITNSYAPEIRTAENWPFDQPFFLIMNFAVGGNWGGKKGVDANIWPQSMLVDYVRAYQIKE
ncbi:MAG: glycoside hydrolase family 16 protein [Saprospiraceae bacterium]|nr:glycoside hydrolase family 16 protein [Lewinella sp.]